MKRQDELGGASWIVVVVGEDGGLENGLHSRTTSCADACCAADVAAGGIVEE